MKQDLSIDLSVAKTQVFTKLHEQEVPQLATTVGPLSSPQALSSPQTPHFS